MYKRICFCYSIPLKELRANNCFCKGFCGVIKDSAVSLRLLNLLLWSHWNRWIRFHGIIKTAESASMVSLRPRNPKLFFWGKIMLLKFFKDSAVLLKHWKLLLRSQWNRKIRFCGLTETAKSTSMVSWNCPIRFRSTIETAEAEHFKQISWISRRILSHMRSGFILWIRA
jgi:hypothetical protein